MRRSRMKRVLTVFLCFTVLLVTAMPAQAISGTVNHTTTVSGASTYCTGYIKSPLHYNENCATILLSFTSGVNHYPPSDYSCKAEVCVEFPGKHTVTFAASGNMSATTGTNTVTSVYGDPVKATFNYYVNNMLTPIYSEDIPH